MVARQNICCDPYEAEALKCFSKETSFHYLFSAFNLNYNDILQKPDNSKNNMGHRSTGLVNGVMQIGRDATHE
jgi:hypothetical protein